LNETATASPVDALILAGERPGGDPLARAEGARHKATIEIEGRTMLDRVAAALLASPRVGRIAVAAAAPLPLLDPNRMGMFPAAATPSLTVRDAIASLGTPLLVTTADHPLLRPEWIAHFLDNLPAGADAAAALARAETVTAAEPTTERTFLRLRGGSWSGCNLFFFARPDAARIVEFWRRVEAHRKRPLAMARLIGPAALLGYLARRLTLDGAIRQLERRAGLRLGAVEMPFGEAAIDVDDEGDLALARRIIRRREGAGRPPA
jgi:GTP:adenosylcobinamide-phosphate guanylyltransferase